jgi:hypothetical protein
VTYAPGAQRVDAVIADEAGVTARVTAVHAACAPGRLDAVVAALTGGARFVAGHVRRAGGGVVIDPIGFAGGNLEAGGSGREEGGGGVIVPDLAAAARNADPRDRPALIAGSLGQALDEALALLAEVAHRGLLHLPSSMAGRLRGAGERLGRVGLRRVGESVTVLSGLLGPDPGDAAVEAWADAYLRASTAADLRP